MTKDSSYNLRLTTPERKRLDELAEKMAMTPNKFIIFYIDFLYRKLINPYFSEEEKALIEALEEVAEATKK